MRLLALLLSLSAGGQAGCVQVRSPQIRVRDLAQAVAAFNSLDPETVFGFSPVPGIRRTISGLELRRFAAAAGLQLTDSPSICVEVPVRVLTAAEVLEAIRSSVSVTGAEVELVDYSREPVPEGVLVSEKPKCLSLPSSSNSAPLLWRGWVESAATSRRTTVWAHVFIRTPRATLVALRPIRAGETIAADAVQSKVRMVPLSALSGISEPASVIGKTARRLIHQGEELRPEMVSEPQVVQRGQAVDVRVGNGNFSIRLLAQAESSARAGEYVVLRNPKSGKLFRARATSSGRAEMDLSQEAR